MVSESFVKSPSGGYVESVFTLPDHFFADCAVTIPEHVRKTLQRSIPLEKLHFALVLFCLLASCKRTQIAALPGLGVLFAGI
jgi:hypothetical protein